MMHDDSHNNNNDDDVEYGDDNVTPMETSAEFSEDASGARVMRGGEEAAARSAFVRFRRWRKVILALTVLLVTVTVIAFVMGRESVIDSAAYQKEGLGESGKYWKQNEHAVKVTTKEGEENWYVVEKAAEGWEIRGLPRRTVSKALVHFDHSKRIVRVRDYFHGVEDTVQHSETQ